MLITALIILIAIGMLLGHRKLADFCNAILADAFVEDRRNLD